MHSDQMSPNTRQLASMLQLTPLLEQVQTIREHLGKDVDIMTSDNALQKQQLMFATVEAMQIIQETDLSIDFALAEINAEQILYKEISDTFTGNRDKAVLKTNALSFIANGALWAVAEGLDIPTFSRPNYAISSGTNGILAGIIPTIASMYALKQLDGKKRGSEVDPNMLAKLFDCQTTTDVDYPTPVWQFLNTAPASDMVKRTRKDQLIDRWVSDKNLPTFTNRDAKKDIEIITATTSHKKALSIASLQVREAMLSQLGAEILKMKRMLLEISMALHGTKQI